jgi:hypothetical protein
LPAAADVLVPDEHETPSSRQWCTEGASAADLLHEFLDLSFACTDHLHAMHMPCTLVSSEAVAVSLISAGESATTVCGRRAGSAES